jgi:hypothetical protein
MPTFTIDADNNITAFLRAAQVPVGQDRFASQEALAKLAAQWPAEQLVAIWNSFAGGTPFDDLKPVKKFTDRKTALERIWKAIQRLAPSAPPAAQDAPEALRSSQKATVSKKAARGKPGTTKARDGSKKAVVLEMMRRKEGATLAEIAQATGWQNHSIRGFISGTLGKRMQLTVESTKSDAGMRRYRIVK